MNSVARNVSPQAHGTRRVIGGLLAISALAVAAPSIAVAATPKVTITQPKAGAATSGTVVATVKLANFKICATCVGKPAASGKGHLHFSLDGGKFDQPKYSGANGKLAKTLGTNGKYSPSVTNSVTYTGLPKGKHTLIVYAANNDHSNTGGKATATFTVK